ncbi:MAG: ribonuclease HII [Candidatus Omnitrophica bacterium]|nr:ribonuclease HII [Candidatus Omnitrophota bacterium]
MLKVIMVVGVDEAGRGPLAGSVVSCALYIKERIDLPLKDSKSLSPYEREKFYEYFKDKTEFAIGIATSQEIDEYNILNATFLSFERAIESLVKKYPYLKEAVFIIDGNSFKTELPINYKCMEKADTKVKEVAYASIVAKLFRDYLMKIADSIFPYWGFGKHKGYPTKEHYNCIETYSLSPLHRRSFLTSFPKQDE